MSRRVAKSRTVSHGAAIADLPLEMYFKIFSYLDFPSIRQTRLVCKEWKLVVDSSQSILYSCHLTDKTLSTALNSSWPFPCVKIYDFTGKDNRVVSATRGTGRLLSVADSIHFIGSNVNHHEVNKMMKYAVDSVVELVFKQCHRKIIASVFDTKSAFTSLCKLVIAYKGFPKRDHTITLEQLSSVHSAIELPSLQHFQISYGLESVNDLYTQRVVPSPWQVFANYLAIAKVVAKFRKTLKTVKIARNEILRTALVLQVDTSQMVLSTYFRNEIQRCLDCFNEVNLYKLHICPITNEGDYPWILETTLLRRQRRLKEVYLNKKICPPRLGSQALETVLPRNFEFFTSVKIALTCMGNAPVDLSPFEQCPNLKTLWLAFYRGVRLGPARQNSLHFTNVDCIPKALKELRFKSSQQDDVIIHQQSILSKEQLRWVIDNLLDLESLWMQLVAEEPYEHAVILDPQQEDQEIVPVAAEIQEDEEAHEAPQVVNRLNEEVNTNANVNVDMFRDLISMPKIKDMKFDMLMAGQLATMLEIGGEGRHWVLPGIIVTLNDIREYTAICEAAVNTTCSTQETRFFPFGFIELTVTKK